MRAVFSVMIAAQVKSTLFNIDEFKGKVQVWE